MRQILFLLLFAGRTFAEEARTAEQWTEELTTAYARQEGFIATYRSEGEGKSLKAVLGVDKTSGLGALHMKAAKDGQEMESRQWNTANDELFVDPGRPPIAMVSGIATEIKSLNALSNVLAMAIDKADGADNAAALPHQLMPSMLLTKDSISIGIRLQPAAQPAWIGEIGAAHVEESDDKNVIFSTVDHGLLVVSRETGLVVRQSVTADDGEIRVLELAELRLNPGREEIAKISAGWNTEGAKTIARGAMLAGIRLQVFQSLVDAADEDEVDLDKLEKELASQRDDLRRFAEGFIAEVGGSLASHEFWKGMLDTIREKLREEWQATPEGSKPGNEALFEKLLLSENFRKTARDRLAGFLLEVEGGKERVMGEIFRKIGGAELKARTEPGKTTKHLLETAIFRAYTEAVFESKMNRHWGEREGLD